MVIKSSKLLSAFILAAMLFSNLFLSSAWAAEDQEIKRYVATISNDGVQRVSIIGGDYYFDPNLIVVKVNVPVEFSVRKAKGLIPHNILIDSPEANIDFDEKMNEPGKGYFIYANKDR